MKLPADVIENRPAWLSQAILRVLKLPTEIPPRADVEKHTLRLLRSIEAEHIAVPSCCVTNRGSIRLIFGEGTTRELHLFVTSGDTFMAVRVFGGRRLPRLDVAEDWVAQLRGLIGWAFPGANTSPVQMVSGWEAEI